VLLGVDVDVAITIGISHNLLIVKFLLFSDVVVYALCYRRHDCIAAVLR